MSNVNTARARPPIEPKPELYGTRTHCSLIRQLVPTACRLSLASLGYQPPVRAPSHANSQHTCCSGDLPIYLKLLSLRRIGFAGLTREPVTSCYFEKSGRRHSPSNSCETRTARTLSRLRAPLLVLSCLVLTFNLPWRRDVSLVVGRFIG